MSNESIAQVAVAALVGAMQQAIQHWFPWQKVFKKELPRVMAYIIGTLAYLIPVTVLFYIWSTLGSNYSSLTHLIALWACIVASGISVLIVNSVDWVVDQVRNAQEARQRELAALESIKDLTDVKTIR